MFRARSFRGAVALVAERAAGRLTGRRGVNHVWSRRAPTAAPHTPSTAATRAQGGARAQRKYTAAPRRAFSALKRTLRTHDAHSAQCSTRMDKFTHKMRPPLKKKAKVSVADLYKCRGAEKKRPLGANREETHLMGSLGASQLQRIDARIRKTKAKLSDEQLDVVAKAREGIVVLHHRVRGSKPASIFEERELRRMLCPRYVRCMSWPVAEREQAGYDRQNGVRGPNKQ